MTKFMEKIEEMLVTAAEAEEYEGVEAAKGEAEETYGIVEAGIETPAVPHAEPGEFQAIKSMIKGHGEQTVLPDDCQFGDNDLCFVEA